MNESIHGERTVSEPQDRVTELIEQQTAISEVLRPIASSPHELQPIFDAILDSATRFCRADVGSLRLSEESAWCEHSSPERADYQTEPLIGYVKKFILMILVSRRRLSPPHGEEDEGVDLLR